MSQVRISFSHLTGETGSGHLDVCSVCAHAYYTALASGTGRLTRTSPLGYCLPSLLSSLPGLAQAAVYVPSCLPLSSCVRPSLGCSLLRLIATVRACVRVLLFGTAFSLKERVQLLLLRCLPVYRSVHACAAIGSPLQLAMQQQQQQQQQQPPRSSGLEHGNCLSPGLYVDVCTLIVLGASATYMHLRSAQGKKRVAACSSLLPATHIQTRNRHLGLAVADDWGHIMGGSVDDG
ncbi:hypothetical protein B0T17DRAFT_48853 [Bombardia bombarda]|uniref:Uncharacterized protein n=1 Tax=Bombardia bombarda TaxID=252184 RepID=A0AA39XK98_9PEZI|nr:hypothetical protein B0T17DRAFT_48853 [Bombardia bombarda]